MSKDDRNDPPKVKGIRGIDGERINDAADRVGDFAHACQLAVNVAVDRGIVIESNLFGFKFTNAIRLGPEPKPTEKPCEQD
jgi:hypothetical protein